MDDSDALSLRVAALTHVGRHRYVNEDCISIGSQVLSESMDAPCVSDHALDATFVCLVADGMGGHPAGHVASRLVIEQLSTALPATLHSDREIIATIRDANHMLFAAMQLDSSITGMGTTIAGIAASHDIVAVFNVGDSRVYRVIRGRIEKVSLDHSESVSAPFFSWEPPSRVLNQCLGGYPPLEEVDPYVMLESAAVGSEYLICSDGLHDMLSDGAIAACLTEDPARSVAALFESAMQAGGADNISIILARIEPGVARKQDAR